MAERVILSILRTPRLQKPGNAPLGILLPARAAAPAPRRPSCRASAPRKPPLPRTRDRVVYLRCPRMINMSDFHRKLLHPFPFMPKSLAEATSGRKEFFGRRPPRASNPIRQEDSLDPSAAFEMPGNFPPASSLPQRSENQVGGRSLNTSAESGAPPRRGPKRSSLSEVPAADIHVPPPPALNTMAPAFVPSGQPDPVVATDGRASKKRERRASRDAADEDDATQSSTLPTVPAVISKKSKGKADRLIKRQELRDAEALARRQPHFESEIFRDSAGSASQGAAFPDSNQPLNPAMDAVTRDPSHFDLRDPLVLGSSASKKKRSRRQEACKKKADEKEAEDDVLAKSYPKFNPNAATIAADSKRQARLAAKVATENQKVDPPKTLSSFLRAPAARGGSSSSSDPSSFVLPRGSSPSPSPSDSSGESRSDFGDYRADQKIYIRKDFGGTKGREGCLFTSLCASLRHLLDHDHACFGRGTSRNVTAALYHLLDPQAMRAFLCARLAGSFQNTPDFILNGLLPREYVQLRYIDDEKFLPSMMLDVAPSTKITSYEDYLRAMRLPHSCGDLVIIAAFVEFFNLSLILLENVDLKTPLEHQTSFTLALHTATGPTTKYVSVNADGGSNSDRRNVKYIQRRDSSRMQIIIVQDRNLYFWAHAQSDLWNEEGLPDLPIHFHTPGMPIFDEILNPNRLPVRPTDEFIPAPSDFFQSRPQPHSTILDFYQDYRGKQELLHHLHHELNMPKEEALNIVQIFEKSGSRKANIQSLPLIQIIIANLKEGRDPLTSPADFGAVEPSAAQGKWAKHNAALRTTATAAIFPPSAEEDIYCPLDTSVLVWRENFLNYVKSLSICANIPKDRASNLLKSQLKDIMRVSATTHDSLNTALKLSLKKIGLSRSEVDLSGGGVVAEHDNVPCFPIQAPPKDVHHPSNRVAPSHAAFIELHLGAGVRTMTNPELILHIKNEAAAEREGQVYVIPANLRPFWECYMEAKTLDCGCLSKGEAFLAIFRRSCEALHLRALRKASTAAQLVVDAENAVNAALYGHSQAPAPAPPQALAPAPAQMQAFTQAQAPTQAPALAQASSLAQAPALKQAPALAQAPAPAQSLHNPTLAQHSALTHSQLPAPNCRTCGNHAYPNTHAPHCLLGTAAAAECFPLDSPARPAALFQTPAQRNIPFSQAAFRGPAPADTPATFSSPSVKLAADRESRAIAAKSAATTLIIMPNNSSKIMQWKAGEEKDDKGFYWSTKLKVQQAWEQHNMLEEPQNYRTFRSTIHVAMIPIICFELLIDRAAFDRISDADLIDLLDRKLKPTGPAEYLIKLRQVKFNNDEKSGTLLHRYRAFAEPFLQLVAESTDAGCPINDESTKLAFKAACRGNELLMMFLQEDRWTTAAAAHHRIMHQLRHFDSLSTMNSMNVNSNAALTQTAAAIIPAQPQIPPPPVFAPPPPSQLQFAHPSRQLHQPRHFQQSPMVNVMNQLLERFDRFDRSQTHSTVPSPAPQPSMHMTPQVNVGMTGAAPSIAPASPSQRPPRIHDLTPHPGTDARGPYWHPNNPAFECRLSPCTTFFCQGCGRHGHTAAECIRRGAPGFNHSGYFADRYPGQGALMLPRPTAPSAAPPSISAPPAAFQTPYRMNPPAAATHQPPKYSPVARSNHVSIQTAPAEQPSSGGGSAAQ